jgi:hypothetical protein
MWIEALYIKPKLSWINPKHAKYLHLLRDFQIGRASHVWCKDFTYIPMARVSDDNANGAAFIDNRSFFLTTCLFVSLLESLNVFIFCLGSHIW